MPAINTLADISTLRESTDVECKLAQGRSGKGALPKDVWESYSAFANTSGGDIFLGLKELRGGELKLAGVEEPQKVLDDLWTTVRNKQKVSVDILEAHWVKVIEVDGKQLIQIHVPLASRKQRPVYINGNPLGGSYRRLGTADIKLSDEDVRRMLAEQIEDSRDAELLKGYDLSDLDSDSLAAYRQMYANLNPDHPWNQLDNQKFLYQIGGWSRDRISGDSGLTRAGLLMFGSYRPITETFPNYMLDYQQRSDNNGTENINNDSLERTNNSPELPNNSINERWIDRIAPDGSWSGNLFDFYHKVIQRLTADLKVPFVLEGDQRQNNTPVHKALREALVNTLVHADYSGRLSVLVVKQPDQFRFRNPGNMRVPVEQAIEGSQSDCRNRNLQNMFRFIGLGENAGSGLPKIFAGWKSQHWRKPLLKEMLSPSEHTLLELHTLSLVPEEVLLALQSKVGHEVFSRLSETERLILATAKIEKTVDHARMMSILDIHPRDLSAIFGELVSKSLIQQEGSGRGTIYFLSEARERDEFVEIIQDFAGIESELDEEPAPGSGPFAKNPGSEAQRSGPQDPNQTQRSGPQLQRSGPQVQNQTQRSGPLDSLDNIAAEVADKKKAPQADMIRVILALCSVQALRLEELEQLLKRNGESMRKKYLRQLVKSKQLTLRYPTKPNHPDQAYITVGSKAAREEQ